MSSPTSKKYYLTTAINYTNGPPHIGHCFEGILSDFLARYHRLLGEQVHFQTGTDEHGLKIAKTAEALRMTPKQLCDKYSTEFRQMADQLNLGYDHFIRTTDDYHQQRVQKIFLQLQEKGDIYLGEYHGWYNVREETFVSEHEAKQQYYLDPVSSKPLIEIKEPSYFFRLSKYRDQIRDYLTTKSVIHPPSKLTDIITRLDREPLNDLSISRTTFSWGVPVPGDDQHCLYVWLDALFNYYTGLFHDQTAEAAADFWPPNCQVIGKDIIWFHAVVWIGLLMAVELPLPEQILVHNFISADDGRKMSKSLGNTLDVKKLLTDWPISTLRFYLIKDYSLDNDTRFSLDRLKLYHNSELADKLGNLVNRVLVLPKRTSQGIVPDLTLQSEGYTNVIELFDLNQLLAELQQHLANYRLGEMVSLIQAKIHQVNQHLQEHTVWSILNPKYPDDQRTDSERQQLTRSYLEAIYLITCLWEPIQPTISKQILSNLNTPLRTFSELSWSNLTPGTSITKGLILFPKFT